MIVSCPSCGTRYRHRPIPGAAPSTARCSGCEHVFPLASRPRAYRVVPGSSSGGGPSPALPGPVTAPGDYRADARPRMPIGMDDPSIAPRIAQTALDGAGASGPALTYRIESSRVDEPPTLDVKSEVAAGSEPPEASHERRDGPGAILGTFVAAIAGAAAGWWLSPRLAEMGEPETWVLVGTTIGLLVAWLGLRWTREKP